MIKHTFNSQALVCCAVTHLGNNDGIIYWCWNHGVVDGVKAAQTTSHFFVDTPTHTKLPEISFFLIITSLFFLYRTIFQLTRFRKQQLGNDIDKPETFHYSKSISSFATSTGSKRANIILDTLRKLKIDRCNVCVLAAFHQSDPHILNNYGILMFHYDSEKISSGSDIDQELSKYAHQAVISNLLTVRTYNPLASVYKNTVDVVFSGMPICTENPNTAGYDYTDFNVFMPNHTANTYIFSLKIGDKVHISISSRNENVINSFN